MKSVNKKAKKRVSRMLRVKRKNVKNKQTKPRQNMKRKKRTPRKVLLTTRLFLIIMPHFQNFDQANQNLKNKLAIKNTNTNTNAKAKAKAKQVAVLRFHEELGFILECLE